MDRTGNATDGELAVVRAVLGVIAEERDVAGLLDGILRNGDFSEWAGDALLLWELPDYRSPLKIFPSDWHLKAIRELGASRFLMIRKG